LAGGFFLRVNFLNHRISSLPNIDWVKFY
jgi:hypothetical protein